MLMSLTVSAPPSDTFSPLGDSQSVSVIHYVHQRFRDIARFILLRDRPKMRIEIFLALYQTLVRVLISSV